MSLEFPRRSECPISFSLDVLGDRWTLLIVRDLAFSGKKSFTELRDSDEGIATNILADRLQRLEEYGIITKKKDPSDGRRKIYRLTKRGADLLPLLVELIAWAAKHDPETVLSAKMRKQLVEDKASVMALYASRLESD